MPKGGVRIQHPTERNATFTLVDQKRPYEHPFECAVCHLTHVFKTYHFRLDETGATIVSHEIVDRLKRLAGHGFTVANAVAKPPPQRIAFGVAPEMRLIVAHPTLIDPA